MIFIDSNASSLVVRLMFAVPISGLIFLIRIFVLVDEFVSVQVISNGSIFGTCLALIFPEPSSVLLYVKKSVRSDGTVH